MPFRRFIGYWGSVLLGRWIGGLLGYKPFFKEYTTDWDYAVAKLKGSWFQRHLVEESYNSAKSWDEQVALDQGKLLNAEYEPMTTDLMQNNNDKNLDNPRKVNGMSEGTGSEANVNGGNMKLRTVQR